MATSTANWHWKNKTVTPWAKQWFDRELTAIRVSGEGSEEVGIERVVEVDGDVELGQRKSKCVLRHSFVTLVRHGVGQALTLRSWKRLITIYDCKVVLNWSGTASDGTAVTGKLTIPEVSHEITLDGTSDYVVRAPPHILTTLRSSAPTSPTILHVPHFSTSGVSALRAPPRSRRSLSWPRRS